MKGTRATFYLYLVEAGKAPPVLDPEDLTADTPYVLMFDEDTVSID
jgi:hypothetical protein